MKIVCAFVLLGCTVPGYAVIAMQSATVHSMRKAVCEETSAPRPVVPPGVLPSAPQDTATGECTEYELRTDKVIDIVRPSREVLLQLGTDISIRLVKNELLLRTPGDAKEVRCAVISMTLRSESEERQPAHSVNRTCYTDPGGQIQCISETWHHR